jgi:hypothetical protein
MQIKCGRSFCLLRSVQKCPALAQALPSGDYIVYRISVPAWP